MRKPLLWTRMTKAVAAAVILLVVSTTSVLAFGPFLMAWEAKYPTSTIPARMQAATGSNCNTCHQPPELGTQGTCYRDSLLVRLDQGMTIEQALDAIDAVDSDGDGVANGVEINMARTDMPGQVGYHPGLIGPTGTDPCGPDPTAPVTNQVETPPAQEPTGACCQADGLCSVTTQAACTGQWQGAGTVCEPNPCTQPPPTGACCLPTGACQVMNEEQCEGQNGRFVGAGTVCEPNPCATPSEESTWGKVKALYR